MSEPQAPRKGSLFVIFLTVFVDLLGFGIVLPLLPIYAERFTTDQSGWTIGALMSSFSIMQFLFAPIWGRLSDRIGRRPVLIIGLTGSTISYAIFGWATYVESLSLMFISRIGAGIAGATISTAQAYIADTTTKENRARGMALIGAAFGLGFTFGPLLAATALFSSGWEQFGAAEQKLSPWPGYTAAAFSAVALMLAIFKLPESLTPSSERQKDRWFDFRTFREALATPTVGGLLAAWFIGLLGFTGFEAILAFLLALDPSKGGFGYKLLEVLPFFAAIGLVHAFAQGLVRAMAKRYSEGTLAAGGAAISVIGFLILIAAMNMLSFALLVVGIAVEATGFAFIPPTMQALISRRSDPSRQGAILGVGQSLGALARILGHGMSFPLFYLTSSVPFWAGALLMAVSFVLIFMNAFRGHDYGEVETA